MNTIEILAPAGSFESLKAGINGGADAVYVGGTSFSARAYANNLTENEFLEAIDYVHVRGKKIYVTINTLLKQEEIENKLYSYMLPLYRQGIDAVIVQDVGVLRFLHKHFPDLEFHASTQMSLTMAEGVTMLSNYGVTRLVPARELSMEELKNMRLRTGLEMEVFVHGALCYSYSGQCLMSSMLGGRSGNRGQCAGPCRLPYTLTLDDKGVKNSEANHLLSLKDLCAIPLLGKLAEAGVDSFKIEGRMKKPEYSAMTAYLYRKYTDYCIELGTKQYEQWIEGEPKEYREDVRKLMDLYNRENFTTGYFLPQGKNQTMLASKRPNHNGVFVGNVVAMNGIRAKIDIKEKIQAKDVLEFRNSKGMVLYEYTVGKDVGKGDKAETNTMPGSGVSVGNAVYRTKNKNLLESIASHQMIEKKLSIQGSITLKIGEPVRILLKRNEKTVECMGEIPSKSVKQPIIEEQIKNKLMKMGDTPFALNELTIDLEKNLFLPLGKLNILRRNAIEKLSREILNPYYRKTPKDRSEYNKNNDIKEYSNHYTKTITATVSSRQQGKVVSEVPEIDAIYLAAEELGLESIEGLIEDKHKKYYILLPAIFRESNYQHYKIWWRKKGEKLFDKIEGFVIQNFEEFQFVKTILDPMGAKKWILNYNMYVTNREAYLFWKENGIAHMTAALEESIDQGKSIVDENKINMVYGHYPYMITAGCLIKNVIGCSGKKQCVTLTDPQKRKFKVVNSCNSCYNIIYSDKPYSLLDSLNDSQIKIPSNMRLDFTIETRQEVEQILKQLIKINKAN